VGRFRIFLGRTTGRFGLTRITLLTVSMIGGLGILSSLAFTSRKPFVIYGEDNRLDLYQISDSAILQLADSTVGMVRNSSMKETGPDQIEVHAKPFGVEFDLCKDETFYSQPSPSMCSGFLVGEDLVATAGHCIVGNEDCAKHSFVFGLNMKDAQNPVTTVSSSEVYKCKKIIKREQTEDQDYALIQLDRPVVGHRFLKLSESAPVMHDPIFVVGHPSGLPTKVGGGAHVRSTTDAYFVSNLDTYGGNSGSAVFNAVTLEVVGILVRGDQDFGWNSTKGCTESVFCPDEGCRGEDSTHISYIRAALSKHSSDLANQSIGQ
jgi:hypothetical protein